MVFSFCLQSQSDAQQRILSFPEKADCAKVVLYDAPTIAENLTGFTKFNYTPKVVGNAAGEVTVPTDAFVGLKIIARDGYLELLNSLSNQEIHQIRIEGPTLSSELFENLENVRGLRSLMLTDCAVDEKINTQGLHGAPQLQSLSYFLKSNGDDDQPTMAESHVASWAAKCPRLQFFRSTDELKLAELELFANHESPLFLSVVFGENSDRTIEVLSNMPNLIGLNVRVANNAPADFHRALAKLKYVELFNWSGGDLNEDLVQSLSQMERLRTARFQGRIRVSDEFIAGLPMLNKLESISFNSSLSGDQKAKLSEVMLKMEGIRELPKITNASAEILNQLKDRSNLKTIRFAGLDDNATPQMVGDVIRANPGLKWIELAEMDFTTELGEAISTCSSVEHLSLKVFDFDASRMKNPEALTKLQSLSLNVKGAPKKLETLGRIPNLSSIQISLSTLNPNDWSFIADVKSLHFFNILDGYCDDSIVRWIKQNKSLRVFTTLQDCVMTDRGVAELCECEGLESITIGGFISTEYIEKLAQRPNLTRLTVCSDLPDEIAKERLEVQFKHLRLRDLYPTAGPITIGDDSLYRRKYDDGRDNFDAMEGKSLDEMFADALTEDLKEKLDGKIVLVEFWGTWCGPCLNFVPELKRLQNQYGEQGFQVLGVHSQAEAETAEPYLKDHPKPWPNLTDNDGSLARSFEVPSYPSLYIFGKDGKLRIAQPHRMGLDRSLQRLLDERNE